MFNWTDISNNKNKKRNKDKEIDKTELELLQYVSHWIYTKLKLNGQITQEDIDKDFDIYNSPVVYDGLKTLEEVKIIYSDTVFNEDSKRTEKRFYSKKIVH